MKSKPDDSLREEALAEVRAVYQELATRPVERDCIRRAECCRLALIARTPYLTRGEALLAARGLRASGRKSLPAVPAALRGACPLLDEKTGGCMIYESRPFGCRTHFCREAGGPYLRRTVLDLIRRLELVDARLGGRGPEKLPAALAFALREMG